MLQSRMLINALEKAETRVAIVVNDKLEEFYVERLSRATLVGNIYKGLVENVHPSLQAAFVNIGLKKNGFLHVSEFCLPDEKKYKHRRFRKRFIQNLVKAGNEIIVQVIRDEFKDKGPSLTTETSIPGRYLVLTPMSNQIGVSKKIRNPAERSYLRRLTKGLIPTDNIGFIIRTASKEITKNDLRNDLDYLMRLWSIVLARSKKSLSPALLYEESDLVIRTVRDTFDKNITEIIIDDSHIYSKLLNFFDMVLPNYRNRLKYYSSSTPLFHKCGIEGQIADLSKMSIRLPSGGYIVIEQTEAMTTIDVNSGKFTRGKTPEETAFKTNMEAAHEIPRQLRLRDLGGIIVIDFIDTRQDKHRRAIESLLHKETEKDKSEMVILPMSQFSLVEIARQKIRPSLQFIAYDKCPHCNGAGFIKNIESIGLEILRQIKSTISCEDIYALEITVHPNVEDFLKSKKEEIEHLESNFNKRIYIDSNKEFSLDKAEIIGYNSIGEKVLSP